MVIPWISWVPSDSDVLFMFHCLQFLNRLYLVMTANNSQGQTFNESGFDLSSSCFSRSMFYEEDFQVAQDLPPFTEKDPVDK
ncbi:hypothetical protein LSAT2_020784, partial [Lamellibrachia satsuma]